MSDKVDIGKGFWAGRKKRPAWNITRLSYEQQSIRTDRRSAELRNAVVRSLNNVQEIVRMDNPTSTYSSARLPPPPNSIFPCFAIGTNLKIPRKPPFPVFSGFPTESFPNFSPLTAVQAFPILTLSST